MYLRSLARLARPALNLNPLLDTTLRAFTTGLGYEALTGPEINLAGKVFCVTGSTDGIGRHTAYLLALHGGTVLVHGRGVSRVKRTLRSIREATSNPNVYGYPYDLSSMEQTRKFAEHVRNDVQRWFGGKLAVLINNAGVFEEEKLETEDGLEMTWAVNVAAPFLLTGELLPLISERILNVTSISLADSIDFDNLQQEKGYERGGHAAYGLSKLAANMLTYKLARKLELTSVTVNAIDPGTVNTKLCYAGWGPVSHVAMRVEDADDEYWAATSPDLAAVSGKYFVNKKPRESPSISYDEDAQLKLWEYLERQTGMQYKVPLWRPGAH